MFNLAKTTLYTAFMASLSICTAVRCMESELGTLSGYEGDTEAVNTNIKSANRQPKSPELKISATVSAYYNNSKTKNSSSRPASTTPTKTSSLQEIQDKNALSFQPIITSGTSTIARIKSEESLAKKKIPAITRVMSESNMPSYCTFNLQRRSVTASPVASPFAKTTFANEYDSSDTDSDDNLPDNDYEQSSLTENKE